MKIACVYSVWGDCLDLLSKSVQNILPVVDEVIIIASKTSNFGNVLDYDFEPIPRVHVYWHEPDLHHSPADNECTKRNFGLDKAREHGMTHYLGADSDELYEISEFMREYTKIRKRIGTDDEIDGMVCRLKTYFKEPTLTIGYDHTLVPFIHKLTPYLRYKLDSKKYPFAYDEQGNAHIDPTRRFNLTEGVVMSEITMHHFSWLRKDFNLKIENSTASRNLKKSSIYRDLENAKEGVYNEFYRTELKKCENLFLL